MEFSTILKLQSIIITSIQDIKYDLDEMTMERINLIIDQDLMNEDIDLWKQVGNTTEYHQLRNNLVDELRLF